MELRKENTDLLEKTRILENEKEKVSLELTQLQKECESVRDFVELKSARRCQSEIIQTQQNSIPPLQLSQRDSISSISIKHSAIPSERKQSSKSSISNALPNLINSYEEQINDLSMKIEYLQKKYDKDMYDWGSRYRRLYK